MSGLHTSRAAAPGRPEQGQPLTGGCSSYSAGEVRTS
jgi:hypothetical protein